MKMEHEGLPPGVQYGEEADSGAETLLCHRLALLF
jgi:hypothetical protein